MMSYDFPESMKVRQEVLGEELKWKIKITKIETKPTATLYYSWKYPAWWGLLVVNVTMHPSWNYIRKKNVFGAKERYTSLLHSQP